MNDQEIYQKLLDRDQEALKKLGCSRYDIPKALYSR